MNKTLKHYIDLQLEAKALATDPHVIEYLAIEQALEEQEKEVKTYVRSLGKDVEVPELNLRLNFVQPYKKSVDVALAKKLAGTKYLPTLQLITEEKIDHESLVNMVRSGALPETLIAACLETADTPRITKTNL